MQKVVERRNGRTTWQEQPGDKYVVTGTDARGKRFRPIRTVIFGYAAGINVYRGSLWLERNGRRHLIRTVYN